MPERSSTGPDATHRDRLMRCRREMAAAKLPAFLVSRRWDHYYLTGFSAEDSAVLITPRDVHVITDGRFKDVVRRECSWARTWIRRGSLVAEIAKVCKELRLRTLAYQPDGQTVAELNDLEKHCRATRFRAAGPIVSNMRRCKDAGELHRMKKAIRVAETAFLATRKTIRTGQTELEIAARLEYEMKVRGASSPAFATICAEGANAALPHAHAGRRKIREGSALLIDWGARVDHYCSDLTRVLFIGSIPPRIAKVYRVAQQAQERSIRDIRPGRRMCDVDAVAREAVADAGFGDNFSHGLGHGLGMDVHEPPSLSWRSTEELEAGMVVTVEPGIYLPGVGGVRIEDDCLVTPGGCRVLTRLPRSLEASRIL